MNMLTGIEQAARYIRSRAWSARLYRCAEDVRIQALVVPKLKLVDVEMQIFLADLMKCPNDAAFHDGPEAFDAVGMYRANDILALRVIDDLVRILLAQLPIPECEG